MRCRVGNYLYVETADVVTKGKKGNDPVTKKTGEQWMLLRRLRSKRGRLGPMWCAVKPDRKVLKTKLKLRMKPNVMS